MPVVDLQFNYPILSSQKAQLARLIGDTVKTSSEWLEFAPYGGYPQHREAGARWLSRASEPVQASRVMIAAGGHSGVMASLLAAELRGKKIATDPLTYPGFKQQAAALGCPLVACDGDEHGMTAESLERAAKEHRVAGVYLMASVHNPLGTTMPLSRRRVIAEVARRHNLILIDDDAYGFCEAAPPASFAAVAPERSYFVHSFTKPYAPAMKVAYVAFPEGRGEAMETALREVSSGAPALFAEVARRLIESGEMERLLAAKREEAAKRQRLAAEALAGLKTSAQPTSFHVWIELPDGKSADAIAQQLEREQILVASSTSYFATPEVKANGLRVALGAVRELPELKQGLSRVREVIKAAGSAARM